MKHLVLISEMRFAGFVFCRIPGCSHRAAVHVDRYIGAPNERYWDARSSGPFCNDHVTRMQSEWTDCEVRDVAACA
jgi:hypothetical protein